MLWNGKKVPKTIPQRAEQKSPELWRKKKMWDGSMRMEFQLMMIKILEMGTGDDYTMMWYHLMPLNCTQKEAEIVTFILH